jgi:mannose-6-phosphate isomerase
MNHRQGWYPLEGKIQHYAWGGREFIPRLLGLDPEPDTPYAEYWLGTHVKAPAEIVRGDGSTVPLDRLIAQYPRETLGAKVAGRFGRLSYLFKVLDVQAPLSIQVHPTKPQAEAGFKKENRAGIPLDAPERNYKDDNHKPELMVALGDFWLLHGFLPPDRLRHVLQAVPEFQTLEGLFDDEGYAGLYRWVMTLPADEVQALLAPLADRLLDKSRGGGLKKASADYWAARVLQDPGEGPYDRGVFSIYFFNLVHLQRGQAIFQDAGIPHSYLEGQNIELMANSDNVLRGGLTPKHVDVAELLEIVEFKGIEPRLIEGHAGDPPPELLYDTPVPDFSLGRIDLGPGDGYARTAYSAEILLVLEGDVRLTGCGKEIALGRGQSAVLFAGTDFRLKAGSDGAELFRAAVPPVA